MNTQPLLFPSGELTSVIRQLTRTAAMPKSANANPNQPVEPPRGQFRPGQSGNPAGRPVGSGARGAPDKPFNAVVAAKLGVPVTAVPDQDVLEGYFPRPDGATDAYAFLTACYLCPTVPLGARLASATHVLKVERPSLSASLTASVEGERQSSNKLTLAEIDAQLQSMLHRSGLRLPIIDGPVPLAITAEPATEAAGGAAGAGRADAPAPGGAASGGPDLPASVDAGAGGADGLVLDGDLVEAPAAPDQATADIPSAKRLDQATDIVDLFGASPAATHKITHKQGSDGGFDG